MPERPAPPDPVPPTTIPGAVLRGRDRYGEREALVDERDHLSFAEMATAMVQATRATMARGVGVGDRVAIWAPNSVRWIVAALGILGAGGTVVPLNTRYRGAEAGHILRTSGARLLFAVDEFLGSRFVELLDSAGADRPPVVLLSGAGAPEVDDAPGMDGAPDVTTWSEFLQSGGAVAVDAAEDRIAAIEPGAVSDLIFTSGTTGRPKGVMVTHEQSLRVYEAWSEIVGLREGDRYLVAYPFFHCAGYKSGWLASLIRGATVLPEPFFDAGRALERVADERVTVLPGTPTMLQDVLDHPAREEHDLSSLRLTVTGAAVVPVELVRRLRDEMTFETVVTGYGLTESCGTAAMCRHDDDPETIAHWSGRALPDTELAVMDDAGTIQPPGSPGEVVTRGYHVMLGYFEDPAATAVAIDREGWLHTGDIGLMDQRGYVRITDRKKDMFIVGGFNAYPAEIEGILLRHPAVSQAAVVGVPDGRLGEVGFAFVILRPGRSVGPEALTQWSRREMANFKVPRHFEMVERLPVNPTGKVLKFTLRERARDLMGPPRDGSTGAARRGDGGPTT